MLEIKVATQALLNQQLKEIHIILRDNYKDVEDIGGLSGISGISLFQFYYSKYLNSDVGAEIGAEILSECIDRINNGYNFPTYCNGIAGAGWVIQHLVEEDFVEIDVDELLVDLDAYLYSVMKSNIEQGDYDFLHGALGYGYYFLKRLKNTQSEKLKNKYLSYLSDIIQQLDVLSEKDDHGCKWNSILDHESGLKGYNLSLSHGMSSIINFLSRLYPYTELRDKVTPLLKGGISYILSHEDATQDSISLFPSWATQLEERQTSRLAWCYGDLGIGISLRIAALALKDSDLEEKALKILKRATGRKTKEQSLVKDTCMCHGAFGNAQIFNRLYRDTKEEVFLEAADFWIQEGINMATFSDGYVGYKQWKGKKGWVNEIDLLMGVAGIGMAILFHISDFETSWDECLMIS